MGAERITVSSSIQVSPELSPILSASKKLAPIMPARMSTLFNHISDEIEEGLAVMEMSGGKIFIAGPEWCRQNAQQAGELHSEVILQAYGDTYALPNKDPQYNTRALNSGSLDMLLLFRNEEVVGTACMTMENNGQAELGRAASTGRVGNKVIQDMRIMRWLTDEGLSERFHTLFATCRTAPDRNIGTEENEDIMRGGQAVSHMWQKMPEVKVAGFGPFYKKHGALEQFAYATITRGESYVPNSLWLRDVTSQDFIGSWIAQYGPGTTTNANDYGKDLSHSGYHISYPPQETGITSLVHGEIEFGQGKYNLAQAITELSNSGVPFMQIKVPVDRDTLSVQEQLVQEGFQAFMFTPSLMGLEPASLWFGKVNGDIPVIETFWSVNEATPNPFWQGRLAQHAERIAQNWRI